MSLTIFSQAFSVGFAPKFNSVPSKAPGTADLPQVNLLSSADEGYTKLSTVKIISDNNDVSAENQEFTNPDHKIQVRIDPDSQKVILEVVNNKTGQEVRQIPGEQQLRLNKAITEYNDIVFRQNSDISIEQNSSDPHEQDHLV
jgi:uncharacterized FlaG/YvyC family protein